MEPIIGIDLGTTNSVVATLVDGVPTVIPGRSGYKLMPSVVALAGTGKRLVGQLAKRQAATNPEQTVSAFKRLIGRKWSSPQVAEARGRLAYRLVQGPHDDVRVQLGGETLAIPEIAAMVLTELKLDAEAWFGAPVSKAVVTVPAYFNDAQRTATKDAGKIAGLDVLRIINEPTAAALAYGFGRQVEKKVVVFDLGGGTFDVSVLDIASGVFDVVATGGDSYLGGEDFDERLIELLATAFREEQGFELRDDPMARQRLKDAAEHAKIELSDVQETEVNLPFVATGPAGPVHLQRLLRRGELEERTADLVERCVAVCQGVLQDAMLAAQGLDEVVLVGGMSRMPAVQAACRRLFGKAPSKNVHPEEVVALGAAIQACALAKEADQGAGVLLLDVTPQSLGVCIAGGLFQVLIPKNTTVPTSASHLFTTIKDNQATAKIMVMQGESPKAAANDLLGELILDGLPQAPRGQVEIDVTFEISSDGIVGASAKDTKTGQRQSIQVTATTGLTEDELHRMVEHNADYLLAQKSDERFAAVQRETARVVKELQALLPGVKRAVAGSESGREAVARVERLLERTRAAEEGHDVAALLAAEESLSQGLQLLKGIAQKLGRK